MCNPTQCNKYQANEYRLHDCITTHHKNLTSCTTQIIEIYFTQKNHT